MAISFTDLFTKLGHILNLIDVVNTLRGSTVPSLVQTLVDSYGSTDDESIVDGITNQQSSWQSSNGGVLQYYRSLATSTLVSIVNQDVSLPNRSLTSAMGELIDQMKAGSQTVQRSVVGASWGANGTNEGNPFFVLSTLAKDGLPLENIYAETITGTITSDSYSGGSTAGLEGISWQGQYPTGDALAADWPTGSGCSLGFSLADPSTSYLLNGGFEDFSVPNTPDDWEIVGGTAGGQIQSSLLAYTGDASLALVGDGTTLTSIRQELSGLVPYQQLAIAAWLKATVVPSAGVITVDLVDGTGVSVINDEAGTPNSLTILATGLTTSYAPRGGVFRLPKMLPSVIYLKITVSTAVSSGSTILLDNLSLVDMNNFYQGGPYIAGFSGNTPVLIGDKFSVATTNTPGAFQRGFERLFNMSGMAYLLPSTTGTPTLPDSMIA